MAAASSCQFLHARVFLLKTGRVPTRISPIPALGPVGSHFGRPDEGGVYGTVWGSGERVRIGKDVNRCDIDAIPSTGRFPIGLGRRRILWRFRCSFLESLLQLNAFGNRAYRKPAPCPPPERIVQKDCGMPGGGMD
jgi:hypothetical protein